MKVPLPLLLAGLAMVGIIVIGAMTAKVQTTRAAANARLYESLAEMEPAAPLQTATAASKAATHSETALQPAGYLVTIDGDGLSICRAGETVPFRRVEMPLSLLSDSDRAALSAGVPIASDDALRAYLEDLTS